MSPAFLSLSFSILALTIASCFADIVTLHKNHRGSAASLGSVGQVEDLHFLPPAGTTPGDAADNHLELLDIVLLASVDGKFHALNRVTGEQLWSMSSTATYTPQDDAARSVLSTLQPLVTTQHVDHISDFDDDEFAQETYIIEPQSGDIYVSASPAGPLQRLPFSMSQLVDMSPFSFGDADTRVFVGRRKTSLLVLELETGRIKAALGSECPWDPLEDLFDKDPTDYDVDLDELDGTKPPKQYPREIYIGRTDYHISIHTRPISPSARRSPPQNLSFSTYGPNNQDLEQQASYRRTVDNTYVEPLPNGEVIAFKTRIQDDKAKENTFVWGQRFPSPIVAIFDVVKHSGRAQPFVLLQPRPRIEDVFPDLDLPGNKSPHTQNADSAYVGLVEETGSLFAMSPDHFPLVIFGGGEDRTRKTIDPPLGSGRTSHHAPSRELLAGATLMREEMQRLDVAACEMLFLANNKHRQLGQVDLHGLKVKEAIQYVERCLTEARQRGDAEIQFIVGKGLHSADGTSKLKPAIEGVLKKQNLVTALHPGNAGMLVVQLKDQQL
ncbi:hypothetical protein EWM64_g5582 [Hericium alpestre]|uniref:Smr domain-containing protein n=1 Tax=Hericium alpestre TaxID=135208 RepID=A0A4Y9ZYD1_9AGAM|nr:hypothetical protein EWM64_g5582 [Hericium alpestre]